MSDWISVKDRLPARNGRYLCLIDSKFYMILSFAKKLKAVDKYDFKNVNRPGFYEYDSEYGHYEINNITHWMPLPERPLKPA